MLCAVFGAKGCLEEEEEDAVPNLVLNGRNWRNGCCAVIEKKKDIVFMLCYVL